MPRSGAVESVQRADVDVPEPALRDLWRPEYLERLARAYWAYLSRISLSLFRVVYEPDARIVVLLGRPLALLRFHAPEYETSESRGVVTWRIDRGLLVSRQGRGKGYLRIAVERAENARGARAAAASASPGAGVSAAPPPGPGLARLRVEVSVANFYPLLRGSGRFSRFGAWLYGQTQLRLHVLVCNGFLRSLAGLDLPPSRVGALRAEIEAGV